MAPPELSVLLAINLQNSNTAVQVPPNTPQLQTAPPPSFEKLLLNRQFLNRASQNPLKPPLLNTAPPKPTA